MYRYETHLHTAPVSKCAKGGVREVLQFYKNFGYDGVFITNHFLDGNINIDKTLPYEEKIEFYLSDYFDAKSESEKIGIKVFFGVELSYGGTDFLVYGLSPDWFRAHPEIMDMNKVEELALMRSEGAFIAQAHPFREAGYINHIRLYPRSVDAVEVINACRTDFENRMAGIYAEEYGFLRVAGTDNHVGARPHYAGMESDEPLNSEADYGRFVREGKIRVFTADADPLAYETTLLDEEGNLILNLKTNPSTGYEWMAGQTGDGCLEQISREYVTDAPEGFCGAPAFLRLKFRPVSPGSFSLLLSYRRSWESCAPVKEYKVRGKVKDDGKISLRFHDFLKKEDS